VDGRVVLRAGKSLGHLGYQARVSAGRVVLTGIGPGTHSFTLG
jgi:hypothetical protein